MVDHVIKSKEKRKNETGSLYLSREEKEDSPII